MHRGYLPIWRKFFEEHPFWQEKRKFSKAEAWLDILRNVHFKDQPQERLIGGKLITVNYGECVMTTRYCASQWGWTQSSASRFVAILKKTGQIRVRNDSGVNVIIVSNFSKYDIRKIKDDSNMTQARLSGDSAVTQTKEHKNVKNIIYTSEFLSFWNVWPNKVGKDAAFKSWSKRNGNRPETEVIISAVENQILWRENAPDGYFRPQWKNPSTWINQGCWNDECDPEYGKPVGSGAKKQAPDDIIKKIKEGRY